LITFFVFLITLFQIELSIEPKAKKKFIWITLFLSSIFYLIWRSSLNTPYFLDNTRNLETILLSRQYDISGHLVFDSAHSYFFLQPVVLHILCDVGGFSSDLAVCISLLLFGSLSALIGILFYKTLTQRIEIGYQRKVLTNLMFPLISFALVSFVYSERSGYAIYFSTLLTVIALWFITKKEFTKVTESIVLLLLILGITFGDTNGILILIPYFLVYAVLRKKEFILFSIIPLAYLIFCAELYTLSLKRYTASAISGFVGFINELISGQLPERTIPWQRASTRTYEDLLISSLTHLSLVTISIIIVMVSILVWVKRSNRVIMSKESVHRSIIVCLLLWLCIATISYIGASVRPETPFSDIRTITLVLLSLLLPFSFLSKKFISCIESRKALMPIIIILLILSSMRTLYEVRPKNTYDPIIAVEDVRLGSTGIYVLADFLNSYYQTGGIVADYKTFNRIGRFLPDSQYEKRFLDETTLTKPFARFPYRSLLIFNIAGVTYPSIYHPQEAYMAAYNFSVSHNRLYDNGIVVIASLENGNP